MANMLGTNRSNRYTVAMLKSMERFTLVILTALLCLASNSYADSPDDKSGADKAWAELQTATRPVPPKEWETKEPTEQEKKDYVRPLYLKAADLAHEFYTKYPDDKRAAQAKFYENRMLHFAEGAGATNATARLQTLDKDKLGDPNASEHEKFGAKFDEVKRSAEAKGEFGSPGFNAELEKGVRELHKEFPKVMDYWSLLIEIAGFSDAQKARELYTEVAKSSAPDQFKEHAQLELEKMDRIGKPFNLNFKAVDGRKVDSKSLKGKVVLVDFWATWCGPCVGEIPHVKEAYSDLHSKGFEIVGISLDQDKDKLISFTKEQGMDWPQYFDGKQWQNEIASKYGIQSIPAMWLVDKQGNLRDIHGRENLKGKVEKLLAE